MTDGYKPVQVGLRPMQARLTVIGFNKAIASFQIAQFDRAADSLGASGVGHTVHALANLQLYMALGLSFLAVMVLIMSNEFKASDACTHWSVVAGDLLMYLALSHTLAGYFAPLANRIEMTAVTLPDRTPVFKAYQSASVVAGGAAWFLATYIGPFTSLVRSPCFRRTNIVLGAAYLSVLVVFCWLTAETVRVSAVSGDQPGLMFSVLRELVQPLRW
jgi:hypothetical protein